MGRNSRRYSGAYDSAESVDSDLQNNGKYPTPFQGDGDDVLDDRMCCCDMSDRSTQLYVACFVIFFISLILGIAAAAVASMRCCGSAWDNSSTVNLACSALYRSCYDVTKMSLAVGCAGLGCMLIGFVLMGVACHYQQNMRVDRRDELRHRQMIIKNRYAYKREEKAAKRRQTELKMMAVQEPISVKKNYDNGGGRSRGPPYPPMDYQYPQSGRPGYSPHRSQSATRGYSPHRSLPPRPQQPYIAAPMPVTTTYAYSPAARPTYSKTRVYF